MQVILVILGVGSSLPWNVFITANAYFHERFEGTKYQDSFVTWFNFALNSTTLLTMVLRTSSFMQRFLPRTERKIFLSLVAITIVMLIQIVFVKEPSFRGIPFFTTTIIYIMIAAFFTAFLQDGLFGLSASLPERYTQGIVSGQALAGLGIAAGNFGITWSKPPTKELVILEDEYQLTEGHVNTSALAYFTLAMVVMVVCILSFILLLHLPIYKAYKSREELRDSIKRDKDLEAKEMMESFLEPDENTEANKPIDTTSILQRIWYHAVALFLVFFVSIAIFPGITSSIKPLYPSGGRLYRDLYIPLTFVIYNFGDLLGRITSSKYPHPRPLTLMNLSLLRCGFFALFMMCNIVTNGQTPRSVFFHSDIIPLVLIFLLAYSNGVVCSLSFMTYSAYVKEHEKEFSGGVMFFVATFGLTFGSLFAFGIRAILCKCNPF